MTRTICFILAIALFVALGVTVAAADEVDYFIWDGYGGDWADAEKTPADTEDDLMCWALAASNILEWTGWGFVPGQSFDNSDQMFEYFQAFWSDTGGAAYNGFVWWLNGLEDRGGGNFWPDWTYSDWTAWTDTAIPQTIDVCLHFAYGPTLSITWGGDTGHAITCWGIRVDAAVDPTVDPAGYYKGVYITDSDDNKDVDDPPDSLRYCPVTWDSANSRWNIGGHLDGAWIRGVHYLALIPITTRPVAEAGGPYSVPEGSARSFSGSASDLEGDTLAYRWAFGNVRIYETAWSLDAAGSYTWMDDYTGQVKLNVSDGQLRDIDLADITVTNVAPTIDAGANQTVAEADEVTFTGTSDDPGSDDATFVWDFGDGTTPVTKTYYNDGAAPDADPSTGGDAMSATDSVKHTYGDDGVYTVTLTVSDDDGGVTVDTTTVTVTNVDPTVVPVAMAQPNGEFILPQVHELTFSASSTDPGSDDATYAWDFGDGATVSTTYYNNGVSPDPYPSPDVNPMNASDSVKHTYALPGDYTVTLVVTDDDGGAAMKTYAVHVADAAEALDITDAYIQALPDTAFKDKADSRKTASSKMFAAIDLMLAQENYKGMIQMLNANLRQAVDGSLGGEVRDDWIIDPAVQAELCQKIDDITAYLTYLSTP